MQNLAQPPSRKLNSSHFLGSELIVISLRDPYFAVIYPAANANKSRRTIIINSIISLKWALTKSLISDNIWLFNIK